MRLIDADALPIKFWGDRFVVVAKVDIENAPTVDAVKHGHWLFYEEPDGYYHSECSECGRWCDEDVFLKGKWHYCPNCGAKMDEVEDASDVDVVEVVRCKDCIHYWKNKPSDDVPVCLASPKDDAFCSEGERKEADFCRSRLYTRPEVS